MTERPLSGKVAVVAGATRGAGRGIAAMLGEAGATVYCTGRSARGQSPSGRPETIEETAEIVTSLGGVGIAAQVDHSVPEQVRSLAARVEGERGRVDVLVNDIWGGDRLAEWGKQFWEHSLEKGLAMLRQAIDTHIITSHFFVPIMVKRQSGLAVEITDGDSLDYRGSFFYDLVKVSAIRLAYSMAEELRQHGVIAVAVTPGFLRSEEMLDHFGVSAATWRDAVAKDPRFVASETPAYIGRAVAALAADPSVAVKSGQALSTWRLSDEYGFVDADGARPHWGRYFDEHVRARA